jgi:hypothetical protein
MAEVVVQKLIKKVKNDIELAIKYYSVLSALNDLKLAKKQIQLLAFTAVRGTITPLPAKQEFVKLFNSSINSLENIKGKLVKRGLLVKDGDMYRVNKLIALDFSKPLVLNMKITHDAGNSTG